MMVSLLSCSCDKNKTILIRIFSKKTFITECCVGFVFIIMECVQIGSPILDKWLHWAVWGEQPSPGHVNFELYPDVREYQKLYQTQLGNLGNGQPAQLFSSWDDSTIDLHFKWMQQYNIETAALQVCTWHFGCVSNAISQKRFPFFSSAAFPFACQK